MLIIYLNREALRKFFSWRRQDGYESVDDDDGDGKGVHVSGSSKKKPKQSAKGKERMKTEKMIRRNTCGEGSSRTTALGLWRGFESSTGEEEIEMRPLMRDGRTSTIHNLDEDEDEEKNQEGNENEFFFVPSDSSMSSSRSSSKTSDSHSISNNNEQEQPHPPTRQKHKHNPIPNNETDPLSLSKYFNPHTHNLLPEYRDPPSPRTEDWEVELRQRIHEGGSIEAWVDRAVDYTAEWWERRCT